MLKNAQFLDKNCKNCLSVGGSAPELPLGSSGWRLRTQTSTLLLQPAITTFCCSFLASNAFYYIKKEQNNCSKIVCFCSSKAFPPIFNFSLLTGAQKCFLPQGAGYPSYATEFSAPLRAN